MSLAIVLHAHLPWVRHPELDQWPEEDWFFEAVAEVYTPLLRVLSRLRAEGLKFRLALGITPTLLEMFSDLVLMGRARQYIVGRRELAAKLLSDRGPDDPMAPALRRLESLWADALATLVQTKDQLIPAFGDLQDQGYLEILAGPATHAILPLLHSDEGRRAQLKVGVETYNRHFGRFPRGLWLPECAYHEGLDTLLRGVACQYTIIDSSGLMGGSPAPRTGVLTGARSPSELILFARDPEICREVFGTQGYPGDFAYREFHRDLGDLLPESLVAPLIGVAGPRRGLGLKTWAVTGPVPLAAKAPYDPAAAEARARVHAEDWVGKVRKRLDGARPGLEPIVVAAFDAELFGHFWFEGPIFLEHVLRLCSGPGTRVSLVSPIEWAGRCGDDAPRVRPAPSSWGEGGNWEVWWNPANDAMWRHIHWTEERMVKAATRYSQGRNPPRRARLLAQAARELCLAQGSDWAYILGSGRSVASFAFQTLQTHLARAAALLTELEDGDPLARGRLEAWEEIDPLFPDIRFSNWARRNPASDGESGDGEAE